MGIPLFTMYTGAHLGPRGKNARDAELNVHFFFPVAIKRKQNIRPHPREITFDSAGDSSEEQKTPRALALARKVRGRNAR